MDKLEHMLALQSKFQTRLDPDFLDMDFKARVAFIKEHSIHLNQEINEMLYELPFFKPWKDYSSMSEEAVQIAMQKARMEMVDAFHFFMNMMLGLGFTADEFYYMYCQKNKENHRRQDEGYTADKSYKDQAVEDVLGDLCTVRADGAESSCDQFITMLCHNDTYDTIVKANIYDLGLFANILSCMYQRELLELPDYEAIKVMQDVSNAYNEFLEGEDNE